MKTVKIKSLTLNNYRCFSGEREFHADFGKTTRISGRNGSGKSTVMNAVMETHAIAGIGWEFLSGESVSGRLSAEEARLLFGGAEESGHHHHHHDHHA